MTPEQLVYLTDEERRAWEACEAATPGPWWIERDGCDDTCMLVGGGSGKWRDIAEFPFYAPHRHAPDERLIALSRTALPAALEALAEARARIAALEAATPGEDPAPHVAGAPDAAGGALGVGLRSTIFECRCCDRVSNGYNDGSVTEPGWHDILNIDGPNAICPDCVKDPTALDSLRADGYYDAHVGPARPVASASGVEVLTNCDTCVHDYGTPHGHGCRRLDNDDADFDAINDWSTRWCSTRRDARPDPGATGCPGWAKREES